jgi:hypothetical protein
MNMLYGRGILYASGVIILCGYHYVDAITPAKRGQIIQLRRDIESGRVKEDEARTRALAITKGMPRNELENLSDIQELTMAAEQKNMYNILGSGSTVTEQPLKIAAAPKWHATYAENLYRIVMQTDGRFTDQNKITVHIEQMKDLLRKPDDTFNNMLLQVQKDYLGVRKNTEGCAGAYFTLNFFRKILSEIPKLVNDYKKVAEICDQIWAKYGDTLFIEGMPKTQAELEKLIDQQAAKQKPELFGKSDDGTVPHVKPEVVTMPHEQPLLLTPTKMQNQGAINEPTPTLLPQTVAQPAVLPGQKSAPSPAIPPVAILQPESMEPQRVFARPAAALSFEQLVKNSDNFNNTICKFPTRDNRIESIVGRSSAKQNNIEWDAYETRIIMHAAVSGLIEQFLAYKKAHGTSQEKQVYKDMNGHSFIKRLLLKRPLMFVGKSDEYYLKTREKGYGGFEKIGTDQEQFPLVLTDYLSYDEMQIAALIGVSSPTYFINDGDRHNRAKMGQDYQEHGVYVGLVGARFEKPDLMESQHILIRKNKKQIPELLKQIWEKFYGEKFETFEEAANNKSGRYIKIVDLIPPYENTYFDTWIYKKRMRLVIEPFLLDAEHRGFEAHKKSYCHVVGLGLGVWKLIDIQADLMYSVYQDILREENFKNIAVIDFSNFLFKAAPKELMEGAVELRFSKRNPAAKLAGKDADKLLVAMYAWDGNAFPGNEYWQGSLDASGDPAAACCSTIAELQNPLINTSLLNTLTNLRGYGTMPLRGR